jgi:hypothetical protein
MRELYGRNYYWRLFEEGSSSSDRNWISNLFFVRVFSAYDHLVGSSRKAMRIVYGHVSRMPFGSWKKKKWRKNRISVDLRLYE